MTFPESKNPPCSLKSCVNPILAKMEVPVTDELVNLVETIVRDQSYKVFYDNPVIPKLSTEKSEIYARTLQIANMIPNLSTEFFQLHDNIGVWLIDNFVVDGKFIYITPESIVAVHAHPEKAIFRTLTAFLRSSPPHTLPGYNLVLERSSIELPTPIPLKDALISIMSRPNYCIHRDGRVTVERTPYHGQDIFRVSSSMVEQTRRQLIPISLIGQIMSSIGDHFDDDTNILETVADQSFNEAREEALKISGEHEVFVGSKLIPRTSDNNECIMCCESAHYLCSLCHKSSVCQDCLARLSKTTGKCPNCQKDLIVNRLEDPVKEPVKDLAKEPSTGPKEDPID